jgi:hypothetical protein
MPEKPNARWTWGGFFKLAGQIAGGLISVAGLWSFFSNSKTPFEVILGSVSMNYTPLLIFAAGVVILVWSTPKKEMIQIFKFLRYAPRLSALAVLVAAFLICWGSSQSLKNARLSGVLALGVTNVPIELKGPDFSLLASRTKEYAAMHYPPKPKVILLLCQNAIRSKALMAQMKDLLKSSGWVVEMHDNQGNVPPAGIWVYGKDISHPTDQFNFWKQVLTDCNLDVRAAVWSGPVVNGFDVGDDDVVILINDPDYWPNPKN